MSSENHSGYHPGPDHPGYIHQQAGIPAPVNAAPTRVGPVRPAPIVPQMIIIPPPGAGFTQWLGNGDLLWIPPYPAPQQDPPSNVAPSGGKLPICDPTRPECG